MAMKKGYPARPQISASRSFPLYYSPLSYAALSGHRRPRTHAHMTATVAEDVKRGEDDAGRTPMQVPMRMDGYQEYQVHQLQQRRQQEQQRQEEQQHQQRQAALMQCTLSGSSQLNLGRMNYAAPAGATAITSLATSPVTPTMATTMAEPPTTSIAHTFLVRRHHPAIPQTRRTQVWSRRLCGRLCRITKESMVMDTLMMDIRRHMILRCRRCFLLLLLLRLRLQLLRLVFRCRLLRRGC